jgi:hypothetical protein
MSNGTAPMTVSSNQMSTNQTATAASTASKSTSSKLDCVWNDQKDAELKEMFVELLGALAEQFESKPELIACRLARMGLFSVGGGSTNGNISTSAASSNSTPVDPNRPSKAGQLWSPKEVDDLKKRWSNDTDKSTSVIQKMFDIAGDFQRTPFSIVCKLAQLGFPEPKKEWDAQYPGAGSNSASNNNSGGGASGKSWTYKKRKFGGNNNQNDE